ncbi:HpcH/HpaI aldolase family protein [Mycobacterium sp. 94-17]|uniref:HpcH/HpaI aldolase family protein n=1 Tax=Mycobacterium sp. 94-17 TaxID=2986147 RepID=UPI002D1ED65A|nr:aldolase/citrate lyase family protein [Mycobacterium sp. 94-17]MEB4209717.1 aldolase/citrate lyase family protein [Mycobacterium sp. 94-17]
MAENRFKKLLDERQFPTQVWMGSNSALFAELFGSVGFDSVVIDLQHGVSDYQTMYGQFTALSGTGATPMVRVPSADPAGVMKALDAGCYGVVCPMIDTAEDTADFVAACRYPPAGIRSMGPVRAGLTSGYIGAANNVAMTIVQIETVAGYENVEEIAAVPGLDAIYPGPADLAFAFGEIPSMDFSDPVAEKRHRRIIEVAHDHGVKVGYPAQVGLPGGEASAERLLDWGVDWFSVGPEWVWMSAAAHKARQSCVDLAKSRRAVGDG